MQYEHEAPSVRGGLDKPTSALGDGEHVFDIHQQYDQAKHNPGYGRPERNRADE